MKDTVTFITGIALLLSNLLWMYVTSNLQTQLNQTALALNHTITVINSNADVQRKNDSERDRQLLLLMETTALMVKKMCESKTIECKEPAPDYY